MKKDDKNENIKELEDEINKFKKILKSLKYQILNFNMNINI
jgi:hypothetical protein